jgi:RNA polymerase-interacting CarD/CdnL/TRCF family regulator
VNLDLSSKERPVQFKVGDHVVHIAHGVGRVVRLDEKRLSGQEARLYYEVSTQKGTVWVPIEAQPSVRLRRVTSETELARYRSLLKSRPASLDPDHRKRHLQLADRMKEGSFKVLCEVVRDLAAHGWRKPLSEGDTARLRKARQDLAEEWAAAAGISVEAAEQEIDALLLEGRPAHKA